MPITQSRLFALLVAFASATIANAQDKKASATIKLLIPAFPTKTAIKIEDTPFESDPKAAREGMRVFVTPELSPGKTFMYKIEATIEPNNYTKIVRTREIEFKAGETITVDLRSKDDKSPDNVIIRWVPTPKSVVRDMCELAKVGVNDVVFDPGCGDGIMVITAVQDFKAKRGRGADLDAKMVAESIANVRKAQLEDKITIKEGNALKLTADDLKDVTVVMLYMGDELNIRLRPVLWEHLPVGARVVSHRFIMGDWAPDKSITVIREGGFGVENFKLHVWTITGKEKAGEYKKTKKED